MATVHLGRALSLPRIVALKQLKPELAADRSLLRMFADEVQLLARIRHKNVVAPIEYLQMSGEFFIVMEYIEGCSLSELPRDARPPLAITSKIIVDVLLGLHAAHESVDPSGQPLGLIHRDVSPQNILIGSDGDARVVDFGVAKAAWRAQSTEHGQLKGKPSYMAPEQLACEALDRRADLFSTGVVLWELLTGTRLFATRSHTRAGPAAGDSRISPPGSLALGVPSALDDLVLRSLSQNPDARFSDAKSMALALIAIVPPASSAQLGRWLKEVGGPELERRGRLVAELEAESLDMQLRLELDGLPLAAEPTNAAPASTEGEGSISTVTHPVTRRSSPPQSRRGAAAAVALALVLVVLGVRMATDAPGGTTGGAPASRPAPNVDAVPSPPPAPSSTPVTRATVEPALATSSVVSALAGAAAPARSATSLPRAPGPRAKREQASAPPLVPKASLTAAPNQPNPQEARDSVAPPKSSFAMATAEASEPASPPAPANRSGPEYNPAFDARRD